LCLVFDIWAANIIIFGIAAVKMANFYTKSGMMQILCQEKMGFLWE
jgi:hypothetical protein